LLSATAGAGLTYWLGALNRRHQERREDETRWYETRLQAYIGFYKVVWEAFIRYRKERASQEEAEAFIQRLLAELGTIHFVGSPEVIEVAERIFRLTIGDLRKESKGDNYVDELDLFQTVARRDLGQTRFYYHFTT
jgi:hypothetical protein